MSEPLPVSQIIGNIPVPQAQISTSPAITPPYILILPTCIGDWCSFSAYSAVDSLTRCGTWSRLRG